MSLKPVSENIRKERGARIGLADRTLAFGARYLDEATRGMLPDDLVLLGAPSGVGKTQLCVNIALANLQNGKRVDMYALEAGEFEIERRLKYQQVANYFFSDPDRPRLNGSFNYTDWILGNYGDALNKYEDEAEAFCEKAFIGLRTFYKSDKFDVDDLIFNVTSSAESTDLIIIDHVHYFDWDMSDDNKAIKEIAKTVRNLALENQKPIILVAHLRKRDRNNKELAAGMDEFHGSSDLTKIATKVITIGSGAVTNDGKYITYFRVAKNRLDNGISRYIGASTFDPRRGGYDNEYNIGWANSEKFAQLENSQVPGWAKSNSGRDIHYNPAQGRPETFENYKRTVTPKRVFNYSERE